MYLYASKIHETCHEFYISDIYCVCMYNFSLMLYSLLQRDVYRRTTVQTFDDEPDVVSGARHGVLEQARVDAGVSPNEVTDDEASAIASGRHSRQLADAKLTSFLQPRDARRRNSGRVAAHVNTAAFAADHERRRHVSQRRRRCPHTHHSG